MFLLDLGGCRKRIAADVRVFGTQRDPVVHSTLMPAGFSAAGAPLCVPLRTMPCGVEFYVGDPDGYIIGFAQPAA